MEIYNAKRFFAFQPKTKIKFLKQKNFSKEWNLTVRGRIIHGQNNCLGDDIETGQKPITLAFLQSIITSLAQWRENDFISLNSSFAVYDEGAGDVS